MARPRGSPNPIPIPLLHIGRLCLRPAPSTALIRFVLHVSRVDGLPAFPRIHAPPRANGVRPIVLLASFRNGLEYR